MITDAQINEWIGEAECSIKEIEALPEAEKKQAICDFLGLDLTQEADKMFMANLEAFEETSRLMFGNFKESGK
jgi:hypothetical protein